MQAGTRVNAGQASKIPMRVATFPMAGEAWHRPGSERRTHRPDPPGQWRRHAWKMREEATREALSAACTHQPEIREDQSGPAGWRTGPQCRRRRAVPVEGRGPDFENGMERKQGVTTGQNLTGSRRVRKFRTMLHAKAKEEPDRRFHALADKVRRMDFLNEARDRVCRNGGSAGVDGERFTTMAAQGVDEWLGELSRDPGKGPAGRNRCVRC